MSEDRWVRIVDPQHVLRGDIDDVWHPKYGTYGWKSVFSMAGKAAGACAAYKVRCRLRDVPPGTKIVDPGPDHELVDPWDVDPDGYEDFFDTTDNTWNARVRPVSLLSHHTIYRRRIRKPWPDQFAATTAAFRKAMEAPKTPQPGEWWFEDDGSDRVFIHGMNVKGQAICEWKFGGVSADDDWQGWHHEPACTGWDWQPPQPEARSAGIMSDDAVGPQRATPKTCRQIEAQTKQAKAELATKSVLTRWNWQHSEAEMCRLNGWGPGTVLEGDNGHCSARIVITAVGELSILARQIAIGGRTFKGHEGCWCLTDREWRKVSDD